MWILTGFLVTIMLCIPIVVQVYRKIKKPVVKPPPTTTVATPAPPTATVATPAPRARLNWRYVWWPVGIVLGASLLYFMYVNYNNALTSDWSSVWNTKHTEAVSGTIPYALAILVGLLTYFVRKTNKITYAFVIGGIAILIAFLWKNPAIVGEVVVSSLSESGGKNHTTATWNLELHSLQFLLPYCIAIPVGLLTYFTSNPKKYKDLPYTLTAMAITVLAIFFWTHPSVLKDIVSPLVQNNTFFTLLKDGGWGIVVIAGVNSFFLLMRGHAVWAGTLFIVGIVFAQWAVAT